MKEEEKNRLNRKRFLVNCRAGVAKVAKAASIDVFTAIGLAALPARSAMQTSLHSTQAMLKLCVCVCV